MTRHLFILLAFLAAVSLAAPTVGHAQTFKVQKFDIKGEGGTDYVTVEPATGRVFVARSTHVMVCLLYTSPSPRDRQKSRMPSSA